MPGPKQGPGKVRPPAFAGKFYPADAAACLEQARSFVDGDDDAGPPRAPAQRGKTWIGGIVPHAGWVCSGAIAGQTIAALSAAATGRTVDVVVLFGAVHSPESLDVAALGDATHWDVPGGGIDVQGELERRLAESSANLFCIDERFHEHEHAVEVEIPLIRIAWPHATILPVEVPVVDMAERIGMATARAVQRANLAAVYLASSDLTHYGPAYSFAPAGTGIGALDWAKGNDRRLLQLVTDLRVDRILPEVRTRMNACGGGAIAAMLAACRAHGATRGEVLRHANSYETLLNVADQGPENAVGYASVVIG
jgi:AmmeMemoRadiSam system protein B